MDAVEDASPHSSNMCVRLESGGDSIESINTVNEQSRRLNTYNNWTSRKSAQQLATAGFVYTGTGDKVKCEACGIILYNWQDDEEPLHVHKKFSPDCDFMLTHFPFIKAPPKPKKTMSVKYPEYENFNTRLASFKDWPLKSVAQKPEMMAKSGFFLLRIC